MRHKEPRLLSTRQDVTIKVKSFTLDCPPSRSTFKCPGEPGPVLHFGEAWPSFLRRFVSWRQCNRWNHNSSEKSTWKSLLISYLRGSQCTKHQAAISSRAFEPAPTWELMLVHLPRLEGFLLLAWGRRAGKVCKGWWYEKAKLFQTLQKAQVDVSPILCLWEIL